MFSMREVSQESGVRDIRAHSKPSRRWGRYVINSSSGTESSTAIQETRNDRVKGETTYIRSERSGIKRERENARAARRSCRRHQGEERRSHFRYQRCDVSLSPENGEHNKKLIRQQCL